MFAACLLLANATDLAHRQPRDLSVSPFDILATVFLVLGLLVCAYLSHCNEWK